MGIGRRGSYLSLFGQAALTMARDAAGAGQATMGASLASPRVPLSSTDVSLSATTFGMPSSNLGNNGAALVQQHLAWRFGGVSAMVAQSGTARAVDVHDERDGRANFRATSTGVALWGTYRWMRIGVEGQRVLSDDYLIAESTGFGLLREAASYDYRDRTVSAVIAMPRTELQAMYSERSGGSATRGEARAFSASAVVRLTRSLALVVSQGKQLADPLRGTPQAISAGAALRWRIGGGARNTASNAITMARSASASLVTVRVRAPASATVELATSHGDWKPIPMTREDGVFVARVTLPSGTHRVAIRVNGGAWTAPPGLARVADDFGGTAGILVVP